VTNRTAAARFTQSEQDRELVQGGLEGLQLRAALGSPPGSYTANLSVRDSGGTVLATSANDLHLLSTAATEAGSPHPERHAKPVPFADSIPQRAVSTFGNRDISALNVKISIVDPAAQQVLAKSRRPSPSRERKTFPVSFGWPATARRCDYVRCFRRRVGTASLTLAQDSFVIAPPVTRSPAARGDFRSRCRRDPVTLASLSNKASGGGGAAALGDDLKRATQQ